MMRPHPPVDALQENSSGSENPEYSKGRQEYCQGQESYCSHDVVEELQQLCVEPVNVQEAHRFCMDA